MSVCLFLAITPTNHSLSYTHILTGEDNEIVEYTSADVLDADFASGRVHPSDLKPAVTTAINAIIQPVRDHFATGAPKALLDKIKKFKITR